MGIRGTVGGSGHALDGSAGSTTVTSGGGTGGVPAGWYDITASPYNATTAATDNSTAIQAAVNAAKASGGTVYVPPGVFKYATPLNCDLPSHGFTIAGASDAVGEASTVPSELRYTGTTSPAISCHSVYGFGLRGIRFTYNNVGFTGDLIDIDGGPHAADCTNWGIIGCSSLHLGATITARSIIRLSKAINGVIRDCGLAGATNPVRMGDPGGGGYVVGVRVENCTFNYGVDAHILIASGDAENISIEFNRFEASTNTTGIRGATTAVDGADSLCYALEIANNWFGDAGAPTDWIKGLRMHVGSAAVVRSNFFGEAGITGSHVSSDPAGQNDLLLIGNYFMGGNNAFNANVNSVVTLLGNVINSPNNLCNSGGDRPIALTMLGNHTAGPTLANTAYHTLPARIALGIGATTSNFPGDTLDAGPLGDQEQLVLGAYGASALKALGPKAAIYTRVKGGDPGVLALQAATTDNTHEVQVVGGTTPTPQVRVSGVGVGFYNVAPVAQAARAGQLTDSTGGAVSSTLAAGITDTVAKNAIASLAAKINALETIIHNLGLSA